MLGKAFNQLLMRISVHGRGEDISADSQLIKITNLKSRVLNFVDLDETGFGAD